MIHHNLSLFYGTCNAIDQRYQQQQQQQKSHYLSFFLLSPFNIFVKESQKVFELFLCLYYTYR